MAFIFGKCIPLMILSTLGKRKKSHAARSGEVTRGVRSGDEDYPALGRFSSPKISKRLRRCVQVYYYGESAMSCFP